MSQFPHLPLFTDAFIADTGHLSAQETGAYLMLMMIAWRSPDCRLQDNDEKLARWARVDRRTWLRIKPVVMEFWTLADGFWTQSRLSKERVYVSKRAEVSRKNGEQGGRPKSLETKEPDNPAGSPQDSQTKAPIPIPIPTPIQEKNKNPQPPTGGLPPEGAKPRARGEYLSIDWQPSEGDMSFALGELGSEPAVQRQVEKFRDFWSAKPGADGRKRDWSATWRNWVRKASDNGEGNRNGHGNQAARGRHAPAGLNGVATALARHADRLGIRSGVRADDHRPGDERDPRAGRNDASVEDADWLPAGGYRAAH